MRAIGLDPGTAFLQVAEKDGKDINIKTIRNAFVELIESEDMEDIENILKKNNWQYIRDGKSFFVCGEDSIKISRMFPAIEIRRPMQSGILNKNEKKNMLIMASLVENALGGKNLDDNSLVCFCVSSESIDTEIDSIFHRSRLESMIKRLNYKVKCIPEALAVILSEKPEIVEKDGSVSPYSGIGISAGAGKVNCMLAYKGLPILAFSSSKSGDFVDKKVAEQTDATLGQVIYSKENKLDFNNIDYQDDIIFALDAYYSNMIEYTFKNFAKKFKKVKSQFETPLDIVLAGGTSMPNGFENKVRKVVQELDLPFEVKEIRKSKDPRNSVVKGLLIQAIISQKKMENDKVNKIDEMLED